jgi:hypothetical protein
MAARYRTLDRRLYGNFRGATERLTRKPSLHERPFTGPRRARAVSSPLYLLPALSEVILWILRIEVSVCEWRVEV